VQEGKEFEFISEISNYYQVDFKYLCNFTLDFYNYQIRNGLDNRGAKIMSLQRCCEYANSSKNFGGKKREKR
jgi:hypothetical protein